MEVEEIFAPYKVFHSFHINYLNQNVLHSFHINQDHHAVVHLEQGVAFMLKTVTN